MITNYIKVALRIFFKEKFYSLLNVIGLGTGLASAIVIFLWIESEYQINRFHTDSEKIFQVMSNIISEDTIITWSSVPGSFTEEVPSIVPDIEFIARITNDGDHLFQFEDKTFLEKGLMGDESLFSIFNFPIIAGDPHHPLPDQNSVAISNTLAKKLFGDETPIDKVVRVRNSYDLKVSAVFEDIPDHSTLSFEFILPFAIHKSYSPPSWVNYSYQTFIKLFNESQRSEATTKINEYRASLATTPEMKDDVDFYLQPFTDRYLVAEFENGLPVSGKIVYIKVFALVGIFILIVACINFVNLATARSTKRAKEIGVRKVIGSPRSSIILQFLTEAFIHISIAILVSIVAVYLLVPILNESLSLKLKLNLDDPYLYLQLSGVLIITTLLSGLYPAFVLSSFQVTEVVKQETGSIKGMKLRKLLVIIQLSLTLILSICAWIAYKQLQFIYTKDMGYDRHDIVTFVGSRKLMNDFGNFKNDALSNPAIISVTRGNQNLYEIQSQVLGSLHWPGKTEDDANYFRSMIVDMDFFETMNMKVSVGRSFSKDYNDSTSFILTKKAVETMRLNDPLGQNISMMGIEGKVVGIASDFHSRSLHEKVDPVVFLFSDQWPRKFYIKIQHNKMQEAIQQLQLLFKKYNPEYPIEYTILEDDFKKLYGTEKLTNQLAIAFTTIAVMLSCIGLFSLASYTAENRKKEIGIRKVMGASVRRIVFMICVNFVSLSIISIGIGLPIAYYLSSYLLESFVFHIEMDWRIFAICTLGLISIMLLTVMYKVAKAALTNPIRVLRNE